MFYKICYIKEILNPLQTIMLIAAKYSIKWIQHHLLNHSKLIGIWLEEGEELLDRRKVYETTQREKV